jgi:GAF domain-containing protein/HAMP domain-containing protein
MILTRKLIVPAAIVFTAFFAGLFGYFFVTLQEAYRETEERHLVAIASSFYVEIENQKQTALALATTAANNPAIQAAFANRDSEKLGELVLPQYSMLQDSGSNVTQIRYYFPDGTLFFSAAASGTQTAPSPAVMLASSQREAIAGLETQDGVLVLRGISPVFSQNRHIGSVEFQIGLNAAMFQAMQKKYSAEWRILLTKDFVKSGTLTEAGPNENLLVVTRTRDASIFSDPNSYALALTGESVITHPSRNGRNYGLQSSPILDYSGRTVGVLDILYDHTQTSASQNTRLTVVGLAGVGVLILGLAGLYVLMRRTLQPIQVLTRAASEIYEGNLMPYINLKPENDEIGILTEAFNRMTSQLRVSITDLEQRVTERTRDVEEQSMRLRVAAEISQSSVSVKHLDEVLETSAQLILDRFHYYHVGIFIVDKENNLAALVASPTEAGKKMMSVNHRVHIGDLTPVGRVAVTGEPRIASATSLESPVTENPFLPETRSELALPLKVEDRVIGILDIHSTKEQAFKPEDVSVMLVLADQLASAIERTRLLEESTQTLNELERAYGRFTRTGWQKFVGSGRLRNIGYRFDNIRIEPVTHLPEPGREALITGNPVVSNGSQSVQEVALPIKFRGQTIGVVHAKLREGYGESAFSTLELAVDRLASSLESARLYEEARLRADREQAISQITTAISSSSDYETILRTTVREIGHALADTEVGIQILGDMSQNPPEEGRN